MAHSQHEHELTHSHEDEHHGQKLYLIIGAILAVVTAVEVAVTLPIVMEPLGLTQAIVVPILMVLMFMKGALVVLYFMHLKSDSRMFALLFAFPLFLLAIPMVLVFMILFSQHVGIAG